MPSSHLLLVTNPSRNGHGPVVTQLGFDRESYDYWLKLVDDNIDLQPKQVALYARLSEIQWELFVLGPIDRHLNRLGGPKRKPIKHLVYDYKGTPGWAVVIRG